MSKKYNISWKRSDYSKLSHAIRKANKQTDFLNLDSPELIGHIPDFLDYQDVKSSIKTRADLNRVLNKLERYANTEKITLEKSVHGAVASSWEIEEFKIDQRVENMRRAKRKKELGEMEVTQGGKPTGIKRKEMTTVKMNELNPSKKNFYNMKQKEWDIATGNIDRRLHSQQYQEDAKRYMMENYIKGLISQGFDAETIEMIQHVDVEKFQDVILTDTSATFDFIYDPIELKAKQEEIQNAWRKHVDENINNNIDVEKIQNQVLADNYADSVKRGRKYKKETGSKQ